MQSLHHHWRHSAATAHLESHPSTQAEQGCQQAGVLPPSQPPVADRQAAGKALAPHMRETMQSRFWADINGQVGTDQDVRRELRRIQTATVADSINSIGLNKVLGRSLPPINNNNEQTLPRQARVKLAQLRSYYGPDLNTYMAKITNTANKCPKCDGFLTTPPTSSKVQVNPTVLSPEILWMNPVKAAEFLELVSAT